MKIKFGVIRFVDDPQLISIHVCGSADELGNWNPEAAPRLECSAVDSTIPLGEPSFWSAVVEVDTDGVEEFEYKFVARVGSEDEHNDYEWEGGGPDHNRHFIVELMQNGENMIGFVCHVAVDHWLEKEGRSNEICHTRRFYLGIAGRQEIHFDQITKTLFLGSCPRQIHHIALLRAAGVTAILNFQTGWDIEQNCTGLVDSYRCPSPDAASPAPWPSSVPDRLAKLYAELGLAYLWVPTEDASSDARRLMLPKVVFILEGLLARGHVVYVHCNAGVGRSTAAVCGLMMYTLKLSFLEMQYELVAKRPAVYIDRDALDSARPLYDQCFKDVIPSVNGNPVLFDLEDEVLSD